MENSTPSQDLLQIFHLFSCLLLMLPPFQYSYFITSTPSPCEACSFATRPAPAIMFIHFSRPPSFSWGSPSSDVDCCVFIPQAITCHMRLPQSENDRPHPLFCRTSYSSVKTPAPVTCWTFRPSLLSQTTATVALPLSIFPSFIFPFLFSWVFTVHVIWCTCTHGSINNQV